MTEPTGPGGQRPSGLVGGAQQDLVDGEVARLSQNETDDRGDLFRLDGGRGVSLQNGVCRKVCV